MPSFSHLDFLILYVFCLYLEYRGLQKKCHLVIMTNIIIHLCLSDLCVGTPVWGLQRSQHSQSNSFELFRRWTYRKLRFGLEPQIIVHRYLDILLRPQIAFGGLDGGVPQQELDLLQIPTFLPAKFRAGATEVVGAEVLDPDLLR
jgi:hypothetical protein